MAYQGQPSWKPRGAANSEYIVEVDMSKEVFYQSEWRTLFGKLNGMRNIDITEIEREGKNKLIAGEKSPVWEKTFNAENENPECRFTYKEILPGMPTFGDADVRPGDFTAYKHEVIAATQVDSPAYPILTRSSRQRASTVFDASSYIPMKKEEILEWREKWIEIAAFQAITDGASQSYLDSTNGGLNKALPGASAGQNRSCWNTWVANQTALTTPSFYRTTHELTLATLLYGMSNNSSFAMTYDLHMQMSWQISQLKFPGVSVGNGKWRAICLIDPWLIKRLTKPSEALSNMWVNGTERTKNNPALDNMQVLDLDNILYIPSMYWEYFRPTQVGETTITYLDPTVDPFDPSFTNTSNICCAYYFTAGALLRGRTTKVWFTASGEGQSDAGHKKGATFAVHYDDAWKRTEWTAQDGRSAISNDRSLMLYCYDPGPGIAFAA